MLFNVVLIEWMDSYPEHSYMLSPSTFLFQAISVTSSVMASLLRLTKMRNMSPMFSCAQQCATQSERDPRSKRPRFASTRVRNYLPRND